MCNPTSVHFACYLCHPSVATTFVRAMRCSTLLAALSAWAKLTGLQAAAPPPPSPILRIYYVGRPATGINVHRTAAPASIRPQRRLQQLQYLSSQPKLPNMLYTRSAHALLAVVCIIGLFAPLVAGHGRLMTPVSRNWLEHTTAPSPIGYTTQAGNGRHSGRTAFEIGGKVLQPGTVVGRVATSTGGVLLL